MRIDREETDRYIKVWFNHRDSNHCITIVKEMVAPLLDDVAMIKIKEMQYG